MTESPAPVDQVPSTGRIVHYVAFGTPGGEYPAGVCRAAIITQVESHWNVGLAVFNPSGVFFNESVAHSSERLPGTWHWPERV